MPPGMFNNFEDNRHADWDNMLAARREFEASLSGESGAISSGQMLLVAGAAVFAVILVLMALFAS